MKMHVHYLGRELYFTDEERKEKERSNEKNASEE